MPRTKGGRIVRKKKRRPQLHKAETVVRKKRNRSQLQNTETMDRRKRSLPRLSRTETIPLDFSFVDFSNMLIFYNPSNNTDLADYSFKNTNPLHLYQTSQMFKRVVKSGDYYYMHGFLFHGMPSIQAVKDNELTIKGTILKRPTDTQSGSWQSYGCDNIFRNPDRTPDNSTMSNEKVISFNIKIDPLTLKRIINHHHDDDSFGKMLKRLMKAKPIGIKELAEATGISDRTIERYRANDYKDRPELNYVIALYIGLQLMPFESDRLVALAGYSLRDTGDEAIYRLLLQIAWQRTVRECNQFLRAYNMQPLTDL